MAYQVLYRKYRPKSFDDVYGQDHVTQTLRNELRLNRVHHAYLFTGSRGTGKTTCAKILSKAVNCLDIRDGDPCGECANCRGIDSGEILDVVEMDAASNRGIDDIRAIIDEVAFAPARAKPCSKPSKSLPLTSSLSSPPPRSIRFPRRSSRAASALISTVSAPPISPSVFMRSPQRRVSA